MNKLTVTIDDKTFEVEVQAIHENRPDRSNPRRFTVNLEGQTLSVDVPDAGAPDAVDWMIVDNRPYELVFAPDLRSVQL